MYIFWKKRHSSSRSIVLACQSKWYSDISKLPVKMRRESEFLWRAGISFFQNISSWRNHFIWFPTRVTAFSIQMDAQEFLSRGIISQKIGQTSCNGVILWQASRVFKLVLFYCEILPLQVQQKNSNFLFYLESNNHRF